MDIELNRIIEINHKVTFEHIDAFNKQIDFFIENINTFISFVAMIENSNTDETIKLFLNKYGFNIDEFKDSIDYEKLKRYINCFNDVINKNVK